MSELKRPPKEKWCFGVGDNGKDKVSNLVGAFESGKFSM